MIYGCCNFHSTINYTIIYQSLFQRYMKSSQSCQLVPTIAILMPLYAVFNAKSPHAFRKKMVISMQLIYSLLATEVDALSEIFDTVTEIAFNSKKGNKQKHHMHFVCKQNKVIGVLN